jgi:hypothetical protein
MITNGMNQEMIVPVLTSLALAMHQIIVKTTRKMMNYLIAPPERILDRRPAHPQRSRHQ